MWKKGGEKGDPKGAITHPIVAKDAHTHICDAACDSKLVSFIYLLWWDCNLKMSDCALELLQYSKNEN